VSDLKKGDFAASASIPNSWVEQQRVRAEWADFVMRECADPYLIGIIDSKFLEQPPADWVPPDPEQERIRIAEESRRLGLFSRSDSEDYSTIVCRCGASLTWGAEDPTPFVDEHWQHNG
jgi:hypothetical protein